MPRNFPMAGKDAQIDAQLARLLKEYRKMLQDDGINVTGMLLFGSHARGAAREWSDIDVAVISPDFGRDYFDERVHLMKLAQRASSSIEPHPLNPDDLNDRWSTLATEVRRWGIAIE